VVKFFSFSTSPSLDISLKIFYSVFGLRSVFEKFVRFSPVIQIKFSFVYFSNFYVILNL